VSNFRFGLQSVLELREEAEQVRARALAGAEREAAEARRRLEEIRQVRAEEAAKLMRAHAEGRPVGQLRNLSRVIEQLAHREAAAEAEYGQASEAVEETRRDLVAAMTERRVMDQLKERKQLAWQLAADGVERKRMDELALGIFQRRRNEATS
jgi:flagellar protein FliJ